MFKGVIRLLAFFGKEFNEIRRQPRLILSLILGPFLILLLFGLGYQTDRPILRTALVVPPELMNDPQIEQMKASIQLNFTLVSADSDYEGAMARLRNGEVDVVEVLPADIEERVLRGEQTPVEFWYNQVNPLNEQWIQYLGYAQVTEINRTVLLNAIRRFQSEAGSTAQLLGELRAQIEEVNSRTESIDGEQLQPTIRELRDATGALALSPLLLNQISDTDTDSSQMQQQLRELRADLDALDQAISDGTFEQQRERLDRTSTRLAELEQVTGRLSALPPEVIVSPLGQRYQNLYGTAPDFMTYYAPGVLALILQHIAVTLGALSLVRERILGAIEFYGVAPVWLTQVLAGKYLGYTVIIGIIAFILTLLLYYGLRVPFLGSIQLFAGLLLLFTPASLGVGFLISSISSSDSQAVQLSMLMLLTSMFFSGFFLPLENFWPPIRAISYALPLTHGIAGFQAILLRGAPPTEIAWAALAAIAAFMFLLVTIIWGRQFRRIES
jgi:ABC-2 type transport system permease protein